MERIVVSSKDMTNKEVDALFESIIDSNEVLSGFLMDNLDRNSSVCISYDILDFFAQNAASLGDNREFLFNIVDLSCNPEMSLDHIKFVVDYFKDMSDVKMSFDDFNAVFSACVAKNIPLSEIKNLFYSNKDAVNIIEEIDSYMTVSEHDTSEKIRNNDTSLSEKPMQSSGVVSGYKDNGVSSGVVRSSGPLSSDVELVDSVLAVMTAQNETDLDVIHYTQEELSCFGDKLQALLSDINLFSADAVNNMKKFEEENRKLRAMVSVLKKLLSSKQFEINVLTGENERLNNKVHDMEFSVMKHDAVSKKFQEALNYANSELGSESTAYLP